MADNNGESLKVVNGGDFNFKAENNVSEEEEEEVAVESMVTWLLAMDNDGDGGDATEELSKVLEASTYEIMKVKIIDNPPFWHPLIFQTAASYITINGNEESCGSSFSDSDTSYMAGISGGGGGGWGFVVGDGGAWDGVVVEEEARGWMESEELVANGGSVGGYCDDEMLAKFLGDA